MEYLEKKVRFDQKLEFEHVFKFLCKVRTDFAGECLLSGIEVSISIIISYPS